MQKLQRRAVRVEAVGALRELHRLPADGPLETRITHAAVEPVVVSVVQVVRLRVGVADAPAGDEILAHVGLVVAVRVLEKKQARRLRNDNSAAGESDAGRDVQLVRENRELVRLAIAIRVLADLDAVIAHAVRRDAMRIVARLANPEPPALVPRKGDGLHDVRFAREKHQLHVRGHLRALHRALHRKRLLKGERLRALLVVRHVRIRLALLRLPLREKSLVFLPARIARGGEQFRLHRFRGHISVSGDDTLCIESGKRREVARGRIEQHHITFCQPLWRERGLVLHVVKPNAVPTKITHERVTLLATRVVAFAGEEDAQRPRGGVRKSGECEGDDGGEDAFHGEGGRLSRIAGVFETAKTGGEPPSRRDFCTSTRHGGPDMVSRMKLIISSLLAAACIFTTHAGAATPEQEKAFVDSYRKALEVGDAKALAAFLYTEGAKPAQIEFFKMMQSIDKGAKVVSVELLTPSAEDADRFNKVMTMPDGKKYKMPVKPYKQLVVKTETKDDNGSSTGSSASPVAEIKGKLVIPVPVPAK